MLSGLINVGSSFWIYVDNLIAVPAKGVSLESKESCCWLNVLGATFLPMMLRSLGVGEGYLGCPEFSSFLSG